MRVRVYDKDANNYFVSEVYAIINIGYYEKYLVLKKINDSRYFELVEYLDKSENKRLPVNINIISNNELPEAWVTKTELDLKDFIHKLNAKDKNDSFYHYRGYSFVFEQTELLISLLKGNKVPYEVLNGNRNEIGTKLVDWNYIETNDDIQNLMEMFGGFHDSVLKSLEYVSGSRKGKEGILVTDNIRQVSMIFDSFSDSMEVVFEGVLALNLRPARDNYDSLIFAATIMMKDETFLFYDDDIDSELEDYVGTWVNSLGIRWRFI